MTLTPEQMKALGIDATGAEFKAREDSRSRAILGLQNLAKTYQSGVGAFEQAGAQSVQRARALSAAGIGGALGQGGFAPAGGARAATLRAASRDAALTEGDIRAKSAVEIQQQRQMADQASLEATLAERNMPTSQEERQKHTSEVMSQAWKIVSDMNINPQSRITAVMSLLTGEDDPEVVRQIDELLAKSFPNEYPKFKKVPGAAPASSQPPGTAAGETKTGPDGVKMTWNGYKWVVAV